MSPKEEEEESQGGGTGSDSFSLQGLLGWSQVWASGRQGAEARAGQAGQGAPDPHVPVPTHIHTYTL